MDPSLNLTKSNHQSQLVSKGDSTVIIGTIIPGFACWTLLSSTGVPTQKILVGLLCCMSAIALLHEKSLPHPINAYYMTGPAAIQLQSGHSSYTGLLSCFWMDGGLYFNIDLFRMLIVALIFWNFNWYKTCVCTVVKKDNMVNDFIPLLT